LCENPSSQQILTVTKNGLLSRVGVLLNSILLVQLLTFLTKKLQMDPIITSQKYIFTTQAFINVIIFII